MSPEAMRVLAELKKHGLLLLTDAKLPNLCALVAGETVRGSWWAHPRSQRIFRVDGEVDDHPDVLMTKLVSGKVTYVHRALWPAVIAVGRAREPWQMKGLSKDARKLLAAVDGKPVQPGRGMSKPASELEMRLLAHSEQFHSQSGAHVRRLESWDHWSSRAGDAGERLAASDAKLALEKVVASLNRKFQGKGRLPWRATS